MKMSRFTVPNLCLALALAGLAVPSNVSAQYVQHRTVESVDPAVPVYTRALVTSISDDAHGHLYIRLKLFPGVKREFSTLTFLVRDRSLVTQLKPGDSVKFQAERQDGENTLTAIKTVKPCVKFRKC